MDKDGFVVSISNVEESLESSLIIVEVNTHLEYGLFITWFSIACSFQCEV